MGFLDDAKKQVGKLVDQHGDKIDQGLDKAKDAINDKTKGKYASQLDQGVAKAKKGLDDLGDERPSSAPTPPDPA